MAEVKGDQAIIEDLKKLGFSEEIVQRPRRLIISLSGQHKTGKTHFSLTATDPIVFFNIDLGTEGVIDKFQKGFEGMPAKRILYKTIHVEKNSSKDIYESVWNSLQAEVKKAYGLNHGTVVIDTATEAYEICRLAHFGKLTQVMPHHYAVVNTDWREFMRLAYDSPMNTILIHKTKPKYVNNVRTSEYEISGMSEIPYLVQANLTTFREERVDVDSEGNKTSNLVFGVNIVDCRQDAALCGTRLEGNPQNTFDFLLGLVHGDEE